METATAAVALAASLAPAAAPDRAAIYYHRELLTRSLDGRRIDLLTISGTSGLLAAREAPLAELASAGLPSCSSEGGVSARRFDASKSVFLLTARVHPGESPASHVFEGVVRFLLDEADPRARLLRERFVFKLVPMINPDGVYRGYYRSDTRGVNLNRVYCAPEPALHPSVFAITALVKQLHEAGQLHFYIDCHAHSNKRGCFLFGNALEADEMLSNVLYAKLVQQNSRWFDFEGCEFKFSEKLANQYAKDARDGNGAGKEGSGRVGVYKLTGLTHVYTLECNYNTGRIVNRLGHPFAPEGTDQDRSLSPQPPLRCLHPKYSPETWQSVGKALAVSALDVLQINPCSRLGGLGSAEYTMNRSRLKSTVAAYIRTKERAAVQKAAKKAKASQDAAKKGGGSDEDGSDGGGSDGGDGPDADAGAEGPAAAPAAEGAAGGKVASAAKKAERKEGAVLGGGLLQPPFSENDSPQSAGVEEESAAAAARTDEAVAAPPTELAAAAAPYWVDVFGTPLVRTGFNLKSAQINRLENAARVQVLETRRTLDGGLRAAISLRGRRGHRHGWMTLIMKDGKENAELVSPQPELELPPAGAAFAEEAAADESEPVAAGERKGGMAFVF